MKEGAVAGAGACAAPSDPLFIILCMPFGVVIGGIVGFVGGVTSAMAERDTNTAADLAKEAEGRIAARLSALNVQVALREQIEQYAAKSALPPFVILENQGPSTPDKLPPYHSPPGKSVDTVLEVGITDLSAVRPGGSDFSYQFAVTGRGRLIRIRGSTELVGDSMVLDSFTRTYYTYSYTLNEWLADDGKLLASELARGYQNLAEAFVNKSFKPVANVPTDKALVYIYMPSRFMFRSDTYTVYNSDNKTIVRLHKGGYYRYLAAPGKVKLWAFAVPEPMRKSGDEHSEMVQRVSIDYKGEVTLDLSPGDVRYVKGTEEFYSFVHRINLTVVDPSVGETEIRKCTLIQDER